MNESAKFTVLGADCEDASPELLSIIDGLDLTGRPFIDGKYRDSKKGEFRAKHTPITGQAIGSMAWCSAEDVDDAAFAARRAFCDGRWSLLAPGQRKKILLAFADAIERDSDCLAVTDCIDMGKPYDCARTVDLTSCVGALRWNAELIDKVYGEIAPTATLDLVLREPIGVVAVITPWNYPLMLAGWKFSAALAAGNCVILKPSELSPFSALRIARLASEAGIPDGVFNVLCGGGQEVGEPLGRHSSVDCIAFTGTTRVGKQFFRYASETTLKHISLECGGKNPCIIAADADLQAAASKIAFACLYNAGQSCNAPGRLLVQTNIADDFIQCLTQEASKYRPGNPLCRGTKVGAMGDHAHMRRVEAMILESVAAGGKIVVGGEPMYLSSGGAYFEPTIIDGVTKYMRISREEVFGPVIPIERVSDVDSAIAQANDTAFGLWSGIWTRSLATAQKGISQLKTGMVAINGVFGGDISTPFGGIKESGLGRDRSTHGFLKYTQLKHVHIASSLP